jgi:hypothetical protein
MKLPESFLSKSDIDVRWREGPFYDLKMLSAKTKGKRFEQIAEYILASKSMIVEKSNNTEHDRIADGKKLEVKGSTITKNSDDCFSFLQIRPDQDYDFLILETFWFDGNIKFYKISKQNVISMIENGLFKKQHGGKKAESRTFCYNGNMKPFEKYFWFEIKID